MVGKRTFQAKVSFKSCNTPVKSVEPPSLPSFHECKPQTQGLDLLFTTSWAQHLSFSAFICEPDTWRALILGNKEEIMVA